MNKNRSDDGGAVDDCIPVSPSPTFTCQASETLSGVLKSGNPVPFLGPCVPASSQFSLIIFADFLHELHWSSSEHVCIYITSFGNTANKRTVDSCNGQSILHFEDDRASTAMEPHIIYCLAHSVETDAHSKNTRYFPIYRRANLRTAARS